MQSTFLASNYYFFFIKTSLTYHNYSKTRLAGNNTYYNIYENNTVCPDSSPLMFYTSLAYNKNHLLFIWNNNFWTHLKLTTCPSTNPKAVKTEEDRATAPRKCFGALSPKYIGCTFILTPATIIGNVSQFWLMENNSDLSIMKRK